MRDRPTVIDTFACVTDYSLSLIKLIELFPCLLVCSVGPFPVSCMTLSLFHSNRNLYTALANRLKCVIFQAQIQTYTKPHTNSLSQTRYKGSTAKYWNCKPFHSVWEFSSFILVSVYSPPHANVNDALWILVDQLMRLEQKLMDSLFIILGDFNNCPTRDENHSHSYTSLKDEYHSVRLAAFGHSEYCLVNHIPMYMRS